MKNKILVVALIAAVLMAGLVLVGCGEKCPNGGTCKGNSAFDSSCGNYCIRKQADKAKEKAEKDGVEFDATKKYSCNCK